MAENAVVKDRLTDAMIDAGAELTHKLEEAGIPISAALWLFMPDANEWRLLFASPQVSEQGPRKVYEQIQVALQQLGASAAAVPHSVISLLDSDAELVDLLRAAMRTGTAISRIRFSKNVLSGRFIDDALIYRVA